jgi:hypothetical protein
MRQANIIAKYPREELDEETLNAMFFSTWPIMKNWLNDTHLNEEKHWQAIEKSNIDCILGLKDAVLFQEKKKKERFVKHVNSIFKSKYGVLGEKAYWRQSSNARIFPCKLVSIIEVKWFCSSM